MKLIVNIHSKSPYPSGSLSNFADHSFELDGIPIRCMESLLQSLKFCPEQQCFICSLDAKAAKEAGTACNWQDNGGIFHWNGAQFSRFGKQYHVFLRRAYDAMADQNPDFAQALLDTDHRPLWHSIGKLQKKNTCLTTWEFISLLYRQRRRVRKAKNKTICKEAAP